MINLTITVDNLALVMTVFNTIQIRRYTGTEEEPTTPITDLLVVSEYTTVSGLDTINGRSGVSDVLLDSSYSTYYFTDPDGIATSWYTSRYYNSSTGSTSGWSTPILGESEDLYYNPIYPNEEEYTTAEQLVIDRVRLLIGDPLDLRREFGEEALSSIHPDGKTYQLDERGWPISVSFGGVPYLTLSNPTVNGYRFLRFDDFVDDVCTTVSGYTNLCGEAVDKEVINGVDIWYHTFRNSDREIMAAYDSVIIPAPLTAATATTEVYILQTAIDLLYKELWEDLTEDGAVIYDEGTRYDPTPGLENRRKLLDGLKKRLDDLIKNLMFGGITGVLID